MKILYIKASADGPFKDYKQFIGSPPQSIYSAGAATPGHVDYELYDETAGFAAPKKTDADMVVLFMSTPDVMRGYELAQRYRKAGRWVVIGGLHASFLPDEAQGYADAVVVGEIEGVLLQLIQDAEAGQLRTRYQSPFLINTAELKPFPHHRVDLRRYNQCATVLVARGCKFKCSYCTVHKFFDGFRPRPVGQIVDEIRNSGFEVFELHADNLIADRDYALELFEALKPLNIRWSGEVTINFAQHDDLVAAAAASGCFYLLVGLETCSQEALKAVGKNFVKVDRVKDSIRRLHDSGIGVDSAMLFGFDQHDKTIFEETLDWVDDIQLDVVHSVLLTPFPGTDFYDQLDREGRLLTKDWCLYDCSHVVYQPKLMSPQELQDGVNWFYQKSNSLFRKMKRKMHEPAGLKWMTSGW